MTTLYYQGSGTAFDKYDISKIGTGDNTNFYAKGHHVSPSKAVAEFYAERVNTTEGGFVTTAIVNADTIDNSELMSAHTLHGYVSSYYGNEVEEFLADHINEHTDYEFDSYKVEALVVGLLTGNEGDIDIRGLIDDTGYTQWDEFKSMHKEHLDHMLYVGHERGMYDDVAKSIYSCTVSKFGDDHSKAHEYLIRNMGIDGVSYENYGNNGVECTNLVIWNDSSMHIKEQELKFEPYVYARQKMGR